MYIRVGVGVIWDHADHCAPLSPDWFA
jgi:hypothetical protein